MALLRRLFGSQPPDSRDADAPNQAGISERTDNPTDSVVAGCERLIASAHFAESLAAVDGALATRQDDADLLLTRAATLLAWNRFREARALLRRMTSVRALRPRLCARLGASFLNVGDLTEAESWMRKAVAGDPSATEYRAGLAAVLHRQERTDEAAAVYAEALARQPASFDALMGLGSCELDRRDPEAAEARFRQAIAVDGERAVAWSYLGAALDRQDRGPEGRAAHERAAQLERIHFEDVDAYLGVASSLRDAAQFEEALALLEPNLQRRQSAQAQTLYAQILLVTGRFAEGWRHNEFRWLTEHFLARRPRYVKPVWDGQHADGKTILLRAEQGMGDVIQFARYASMFKALGATVHLAVPPELANLARGIHAIDRVIVLGADETTSEFDYYIPLLSLPRVFGTQLDTIPADIPYVDVERDRLAHWAARLATDAGLLKVGLVWAGSPMHMGDRLRSISLPLLASLAQVDGVRWHSLQKGAREEDAHSPPAGWMLENLGPELADFSDTAAAICQLDLVICVDTAVAHLAGALGKPVWILVPTSPDWRWLVGREDTPWYPTARLFRQAQRGEWAGVVDRVKSALEEWVRGAQRVVARPQTHAELRPPLVAKPTDAPGCRPGYSAVAETRLGILEYFPDDGGAGESVGWYGEWLQPQLDLLADLVRLGATVLEVGAGIGAHAAFLSALIGDGGHLFIYEWRPLLPRILRQNLAANHITAVTIMRRKLGRRGMPASASIADGAPVDNSLPTDNLETETLDELQLERLDWIKVNDGISVLDVLEGASETLWRLRPRLFLSATAATVDRLAGIAKEHGYRCWRHECTLFNAANFNRRANDIFEGRTALALLAVPEEVELVPGRADCVELR